MPAWRVLKSMLLSSRSTATRALTYSFTPSSVNPWLPLSKLRMTPSGSPLLFSSRRDLPLSPDDPPKNLLCAARVMWWPEDFAPSASKALLWSSLVASRTRVPPLVIVNADSMRASERASVVVEGSKRLRDVACFVGARFFPRQVFGDLI